MKTGIELIASERKRQIEKEGWTPEHDSEHVCGELSDAAICYAMRGYWKTRLSTWFDMIWPFGIELYKPSENNRVRDLAKAGALIAAEIDRINKIKNKA